jgi:hypothetical protein
VPRATWSLVNRNGPAAAVSRSTVYDPSRSARRTFASAAAERVARSTTKVSASQSAVNRSATAVPSRTGPRTTSRTERLTTGR